MTLDEFDIEFQRLMEEDMGVSPLLEYIRGSKGRFPSIRSRDTLSVASELYLRIRNDPRGPISWTPDGSAAERMRKYVFQETWDLIREWIRKEYRRSQHRVGSLDSRIMDDRERPQSQAASARETFEYWQNAAAQCLTAEDFDVFLFLTHSLNDVESKPDFDRIASTMRLCRDLDVTGRWVRDRWRNIKQRMRDFETSRQNPSST